MKDAYDEWLQCGWEWQYTGTGDVEKEVVRINDFDESLKPVKTKPERQFQRAATK